SFHHLNVLFVVPCSLRKQVCTILHAINFCIHSDKPIFDCFKAFVYVYKTLVYLLKTFIYLLKALIYFLKTSIYLFKAFIYLLKTSIYLLKALVDLFKSGIHLILQFLDGLQYLIICHVTHSISPFTPTFSKRHELLISL